MKIADRAITELHSLREATVGGCQARFEEFQRLRALQARWNTRHPILAKLLHWPIVGSGLRERRQLYVDRMSSRELRRAAAPRADPFSSRP